MKTAVTYYSRTGNTRKIAKAMAEAIGTQAIDISLNNLVEPVGLLLVGGAVYGGGLDDALVSFLKSLTPEKVKRAAIFSTYFMAESASGMIEKLLMEQKVTVVNERFFCKGKFLLFSRRFPGSDDIKNAKQFAEKMAAGARNY